MPRTLLALTVAVVATGCGDVLEPENRRAALSSGARGAAAPTSVLAVTAAGATHRIWPYTGVDFTGTPQDPMNLVFAGEADPRNVRAALLSLPGNRAGTPFAAFDCTWKDAIGGIQTTYSEEAGWEGSVVQLECGDYDPFRYHLRLFRAGPWTLGQAHVEILVPGTHDHAVLSWEVGEQFVMVDFMRSGLLAAAPSQTGLITPAPSFGHIHPAIYNGLPPALRMLAGGPMENVTQPVPIQTNGSATVLVVRERLPLVEEVRSYAVDLTFNQTIPKPFCSEHEPFVYVHGPLRLRQEVVVSASGAFSSRTEGNGELQVTPVDPMTGERGTTAPATIHERHASEVDGTTAFASSLRQLRIHHGGAPQQLRIHLRVGPAGVTTFSRNEHCGG
jgi:hypothetical protein